LEITWKSQAFEGKGNFGGKCHSPATRKKEYRSGKGPLPSACV